MIMMYVFPRNDKTTWMKTTESQDISIVTSEIETFPETMSVLEIETGNATEREIESGRVPATAIGSEKSIRMAKFLTTVGTREAVRVAQIIQDFAKASLRPPDWQQ